MVEDINRIYKTNYILDDRFSRKKSIEMFKLYVKAYHKEDNWITIAKSWNQGIAGMYKYPKRAESYINLIKQQINDHNTRLYSYHTYYSSLPPTNNKTFKDKRN